MEYLNLNSLHFESSLELFLHFSGSLDYYTTYPSLLSGMFQGEDCENFFQTKTLLYSFAQRNREWELIEIISIPHVGTLVSIIRF